MSVTLAAAERPTRLSVRQRIALIVLLSAGFTLAVDFSILTVALPRIGRDVGIPTGSLQWVSTSYALCAAGFTLLFGRISDLVGRKRLFLIGVGLLGVSSLCGGLAADPLILLAARVAQGTATAMITPAALSLLTTSFPEGPARDRALGLNGALMAAGFTAGAILGGLLTDMLSWRWAFFINVAVAVVVLCVAPIVLRERRSDQRPRIDVPGAITVSLGLVAIVYGATTAGRDGWASPVVWVSFAAAVVFLLLCWQIERRVSQPLIALTVLAKRQVSWGNVAGLIAFATETSLVFPLTLYLQDVLGLSPLLAGLSFGVLGIGTVLGGLLASKIISRTDAKKTIILGFAVQAAATIPLAFIGPDRSWLVPLLVLTFVGGVANLIAIIGYVVASTSGLPDHQQGLATGLVTMSQQVGIALGTPVMSAVISSRSTSDQLLPGLQTAIAVNGLLCVVAAVLMKIALRLPSGNQAYHDTTQDRPAAGRTIAAHAQPAKDGDRSCAKATGARVAGEHQAGSEPGEGSRRRRD